LAPRSRSPPDPLAPALFPYTTLFRSMHQAFLQQNFDLPPGSVPCHIVNSSEAFVQLARQGTTCCMIPHLQIEKELASGELIDLTDRKSTRLNSSHVSISYAVFCLKKN